MSGQQKRKSDDSRAKVSTGKSKKRKRKNTHQNAERVEYKDIVKENPLFEKYYKEQKLVPDGEWDRFMETLRNSLPATFRITSTTNNDAFCLKQCLQERFFTELHKIEVDGERVPMPQPIPWYPDDLAWHVSLSKKFIRKSPLAKKFHNFLVKENEQGNISRQEAVSMIPPLLLDVHPHHMVLDMCAAPGSKTAQLIEFLHSADTPDSTIPSGVVIANDADAKRCYMLVHQAKRLNSPCFMVTNHDAAVFPQLYYHKECGTRVALSYDRILCDVPCSGDGTLRKNPMIWHSWSPSLSTGLHKLQLRILTRGLELLAVNGRLVYSTCTFNPVENEAVIGSLLRQCEGAISLVDVSNSLRGLRYIPGLTSWKVMGKGGDWLEWGDDKDMKLPRPLVVSMFPPSVGEAQLLGLDKCVRILPHHQDTGGFFVAVLEKNRMLPWQKKPTPLSAPKSNPTATKTDHPVTLQEATELPVMDPPAMDPPDLSSSTTKEDTPAEVLEPSDLTTNQIEPPSVIREGEAEISVTGTTSDVTSTPDTPSIQGDKVVVVKPPSTAAYNMYHKRGKGCFKEDPYVFLSSTDPDWKRIRDYFGFQQDFPAGQLLTRTETGKKRNVYLTSRLVRELVIRNGTNIKIINTGIRALGRCPLNKGTCPFRFSQEAVTTLLPFVSKRLVSMTASDVKTLLQEPNPLLSNLSQCFNDSAQHIGVGPVILNYYPSNSQSDQAKEEPLVGIMEHPIHLSAWLAAKSCRLFVGRPDRYHYLVLLGMEPLEEQNLETVSSRFDDVTGEETRTETPNCISADSDCKDEN